VRKSLIILLLVIFLSGCGGYGPLRRGECILIDYPEKNLVLTFSIYFKLEKMPHELDGVGYKMDDLIHILVGDSVSVLDQISIEPEVLEKEENDKTYKVYRYYRSKKSVYASSLDVYSPVAYVDLYIKDSKIEIIKVKHMYI